MTAPAGEATAGPLAGVRALDLAGEAGVFMGRQLAELGADVIRVESPAGGGVRSRHPFIDGVEGQERSLHHLHFNVNKRGITLDHTLRRGADLLRRLVGESDIVLETATPGTMDALDLGYESLRQARPGLIYVSITPFGQQGPFRAYRGNDLVGVATSGLMYLNGFAQDAPNMPGAEQAYHMASVVACSSSLIALVERERDPQRRGRRIDVSIQEAASMATLQTANANIYAWHGGIPGRRPQEAAERPLGLIQCRDGLWVSFVIPPPFWEAYFEWLDELGIEHSVSADEMRDPARRGDSGASVRDATEELASRYDRATLFHESQRRRLLAMPVNDVAQLLDDEQLRERGFFVDLEHPHLGRTLTDGGVPYHFSSSAVGITRPAPLLGEHNREVYVDLLGLTEHEVDGLRGDGVI